MNQTPPDGKFIVEDEVHFLLHCQQHEKLRSEMYSKIAVPSLSDLTDRLKVKYLLTCENIARNVGQFVKDAFDKRPIK